MFDVKRFCFVFEWQRSAGKLMQIILEKKLCRKNLKIKISDERKEKNAHAKKNGLKIQERLIDWSREVF